MTQIWRAPWASFRELAATALRERVTTLRRLIGPVSVETVQTMLLEEFAKAWDRPLKPGPLTPAEADYARQVAARLTSVEYLNLHNGKDRVAPLKSLKISARVFIRAAEVVVNGYQIRASFRVCDDLIEAARLESEPTQRWTELEAQLRGVPFKEWQRSLLLVLT
jgi:hypothetical protein